VIDLSSLAGEVRDAVVALPEERATAPAVAMASYVAERLDAGERQSALLGLRQLLDVYAAPLPDPARSALRAVLAKLEASTVPASESPMGLVPARRRPKVRVAGRRPDEVGGGERAVRDHLGRVATASRPSLLAPPPAPPAPNLSALSVRGSAAAMRSEAPSQGGTEGAILVGLIGLGLGLGWWADHRRRRR